MRSALDFNGLDCTTCSHAKAQTMPPDDTPVPVCEVVTDTKRHRRFFEKPWPFVGKEYCCIYHDKLVLIKVENNGKEVAT